MKKHITTIILVLIFVIGLSLLLYPTFSDYWNSMVQSRAIATYDNILNEMEPEDFTDMFAAADEYNSKIKDISFPLMNADQVPGYFEALDVGDTGIMGYITIPKIDVELPIYHGTSEQVMSQAVGHVQGSSLPVGGPSTHSVLSTHRGLPSARLFTDLDKMQEGDVFTITVLDRLLTYEVDQILIVEPSDVNELYVEDGKDYCTLVTCTPYGINTHRMLVRGERIENAEEAKVIRVTADALQIDPVIVAPVVAAPILLTFILWLIFRPKKKKR